MQFFRQFAGCSIGELWRFKLLCVVKFSLRHYLTGPKAARLFYDPFETRCVISRYAAVVSLLRNGRIPEVIPPIVRAVAIFVVDLVFRPPSCHPKPNDPTRKVMASENGNLHIAIGSEAASLLSRKGSVPLRTAANAIVPRQNARQRIIRQKPPNRLGADSFVWNLGFSHVDPLLIVMVRADVGRSNATSARRLYQDF